MHDLTPIGLGALVSGLVFMVCRRAITRAATTAAPQHRRDQRHFGELTPFLVDMIPARSAVRSAVAKELVAVGAYRSSAIDNFFAARNLACVLAILLTAFVFAAGGADGRELTAVLVGGTASLMCFSVPRVVLSMQAARHLRQIEQGLPDAIDMLAMAVTSGAPLELAVSRVAAQMRTTHPRLSAELSLVAKQCGSASLELAFREFGKRIDLPEVVALCTLMVQSRRLGGGIVESLSDYATRLRQDRRSRSERSGNTASIKLLLPVVLCLSPPIAVMLVGPAFIDLRDFIMRDREEGRRQTVAADLLSADRRPSTQRP